MNVTKKKSVTRRISSLSTVSEVAIFEQSVERAYAIVKASVAADFLITKQELKVEFSRLLAALGAEKILKMSEAADDKEKAKISDKYEKKMANAREKLDKETKGVESDILAKCEEVKGRVMLKNVTIGAGKKKKTFLAGDIVGKKDIDEDIEKFLV